MSEHWGFACLSHDPPITMDEFGGVGGRPNHAKDAMIEAYAIHRAGRWPRIEAFEGSDLWWPAPLVGATGCESAAPLVFLDQHPRCKIALWSEYGDTWLLDSNGAQQVSGRDDRRSQKPVRDFRGTVIPGEYETGVYPPEGEFRCMCAPPLLAWSYRDGPEMWVRCLTCGGTSLPGERG